MGTPNCRSVSRCLHGTSRPLLLQWRLSLSHSRRLFVAYDKYSSLDTRKRRTLQLHQRDNIVTKKPSSPGTSPPKGHCHSGRLERQYTLEKSRIPFLVHVPMLHSVGNVGGLDQGSITIVALRFVSSRSHFWSLLAFSQRSDQAKLPSKISVAMTELTKAGESASISSP
jgi:hypothetical protein